MMKGKFFLIMCLIAAHVAGVFAQDTYVWNTVKMGGGGFVTGIITHPTAKDVVYMRTDVGGAYRWNADSESWEGMTDWINKDQVSLLGVESIAVDPSNPDKVYMLCGTTYWNNGLTMILRSEDRGQSWKKTDVTAKFKAHGNGGGRGCDERLAVDPHNPKHIVCGTRWNGLWKSTNAGASWTKVSKFTTPTGTHNDNGVTCVFFDPDIDSTYYVAVSSASDNLYVTRDAGKSFALVDGVPAGVYMQHVAVVGRTAYMTFATNSCPNVNDNSQGAIMTLNLDDMTWADITPSGYVRSFSGISVDPQNPKRIVATTACLWQTGQNWISGTTTWGDEVLRTTNGGKTWTQLFGSGKMKFSAGEFAWMKSSSQLHWAGDIELDPNNPKRAWVISGNGIYSTTNIWNTSTVSWTFCVSGLEETVPSDFVSGTNGAQLLSVIGDYDGFRHETPYTASAQGRHSPSVGTSSSIAVGAINTDICARAGGSSGQGGFYSTNNGKTWKKFKTYPGTTGEAYSGYMAVSADGSTMLWSPKGAGVEAMFVTHDQGSTWSQCEGAPTGVRPVADAVNPHRFYAIKNSTLYRSSDAGDTWQAATTKPGNLYGRLCAVPGHEGHLLMSAAGTIKHSTDGGDTWQTINGVSSVECVAVGKEAPDADYPTLFAYGKRGTFTGIYRSTDGGATWLCVNDADHQFGGLGNAGLIEADKQVFGRVYMSTAGRGIAFGEPSTGNTANSIAVPSHAKGGVAGERCFTLGGHSLPKNYRGIVIVQNVYSDGHIESKKQLIK